MEVDSEPTADLASVDAREPISDVNPEPEAQTRSNAIHVTGVDEMSTADIEKMLTTYYNKPFQIEWIDDTSLNLVYEDPEDAFQALVALTAPEEFEAPEPIAPEQLRRIKPVSTVPDVVLKARFALSTDKKSTGSRARSRYYLLHGEPTRKDDLVRFGTRRSKPMKYGFKGDIITKSKREDRVGDLFPEKAPRVNLEDMDVDMGDLMPNKKSKRGSRGGRRNRNRNKSKPDLFADKLDGPKKASSDRKEETNTSTSSQPASVYQNMDY